MRSIVTVPAAMFLVLVFAARTLAGDSPETMSLQKAKLGTTGNVHAFGETLLAGQPTAEDLAEAKRRGISAVINLRETEELDWDERAAVDNLSLEYHHIPFRKPESLTDDVFEKVRDALRDADKKPVLLHCASANRVGAVWAAFRVLDQGLTLEAALAEAKEIGMRTPAYERIVKDYIARQPR